MTKTYTAQVRWEDGQWLADVDDVPGAHTYAKTMSTLRKRLREVIVLMDDRPDADLHDEDAFTVQVHVRVAAHDTVSMTDSASAVLASRSTPLAGASPPAGTAVLSATSELAVAAVTPSRPDEALQRAAEARRRAADAEAEAEHATAIAVLMAQQAGIGMRDAAMLLGISHQRVQQIAAAAAREDAAASR